MCLYTVDDLKNIIQDNLHSRQALRYQSEAARDKALARADWQLAQGRTRLKCCIFCLANTLTNHLIHPPCAGLCEAAAQGDLEMLNLIKRRFYTASKNLYRLDGRNPCR